MVLIRNNVTKESTYGWYPAQTSIYENPRAKHGYDKECLFRHWESQLHHTNPVGVSPVIPHGLRSAKRSGSKLSRGSKTPTSQGPQFVVSGSRPASISKSHTGITTPLQQFAFDRRPSSAGNRIPTPSINRKFHGWQPQSTFMGVVDPNGPFIAPSPQIDNYTADNEPITIATPQPDFGVQEAAVSMQRPSQDPRVITPAQHISGSYSRVQSASLNRPRVSPPRSIKSAGSRAKSRVSADASSISLNMAMKIDSNTTNMSYQPETYRPQAPTQFMDQMRYEEQEELERAPSPVIMRTPSPQFYEPSTEATYEDQINKYGWLAEVQGDPLNLKKLTERLPYAVECENPVIGEYPYKTRVTLGDTFFLNTIPRKPLSFAVHPEWQSENFVAKRQELEKQGRKFHVRNFGFVY